MPHTKIPTHRATRGSAFGICRTFVPIDVISASLSPIIEYAADGFPL